MINNRGTQRSVKKGEYALPEGNRKVKVRLKNNQQFKILEGTKDVQFKNGEYCFELPSGEWMLAEFEF